MIGFAGLSHLGLVSSFAAAAKGFDVVAYDPDPELCDGLEAGRLPVSEPGLDELLRACRPKIRFTTNPNELGNCRLVFVTLDVPTDQENRSDLAPLELIIDQANAGLTPGSTLVVMSQVPVGFTRRLAGDLAGEKGHWATQVFCQVETLIIGRAVEKALNPELLAVGCLDPRQRLPADYAQYLQVFGAPILPMRYESAELAKLSINAYLVSSVSTANTLAELCESAGADWQEIEPALRLDPRIGPQAYISPGLGLSGGHLERDVVTIRALAAEFGTHSAVVEAWESNSRNRRNWMLRTIHSELNPNGTDPTIAVWGLAYKPNTDSTKNSPALELIDALTPFPVRAYDPLVEMENKLRPDVSQEKAALDACRGAEVLAVPTPWPEFAFIDLAQVRELMAGRIVVDPFGILDERSCVDLGFSYFRLGTHPGRPGSEA